MTTFQYSAIDNQGKLQKGTIEADTAKLARQGLRDKNLMPTAVALLNRKIKISFLPQFSWKEFSLRLPVSNQELTLITRQLATLFAAGLPISEVLTAVAEQNSQPKAKSILLAIKSKVMEGHSFASALRAYPQIFSSLYCGIIASGEKSGNLAPVLLGLADYTEQQYKMKQKISHALLYPGALIVVSLTIILFLLDYVVPKMVAVYSHLNQALPWLTQILIGFSKGLKNVGWYLFFMGLATYWGFHTALKKKPLFREKFHHFLLRLPLLGKAIQTVNTARYAKTLAMLSSSGVSILEAMSSASQLITLIPIRHALETAAQQVREGAPIHLALKQTRYFSPLSIHLIASGEASGQLEALLERTAVQQEDEITQLITTVLALFEPALILVMGAVVLFIVLAVLLPIFDLNQVSL